MTRTFRNKNKTRSRKLTTIKKNLNQIFELILEQENEKKRLYNHRILQIEHGTFTPLIFTCFGGMSRECQKFYSRLSEIISDKRELSQSLVTKL